MLRLLRKIVLLSSFFAIYTFANDAMISQMSSAFFSSFFSFFSHSCLRGNIICRSIVSAKEAGIFGLRLRGHFSISLHCGANLNDSRICQSIQHFFYYRRHSSNTSYHSCSDRFQRNPTTLN